MVDTWTQPLVAEQDRRRVETECSLHPGVLVKRGERDGEAAKPFVLQPRVDSRTSLSLVLQQIRLNLIFLGGNFGYFPLDAEPGQRDGDGGNLPPCSCSQD